MKREKLKENLETRGFHILVQDGRNRDYRRSESRTRYCCDQGSTSSADLGSQEQVGCSAVTIGAGKRPENKIGNERGWSGVSNGVSAQGAQ